MKDVHAIKFGRNVRKMRLKRGLTQEALAERADMSVNYIGFIENGKRSIILRNIVKIANALNADPKELFQGLIS
jgi:transcriptional regulator with XRE-family HTH domain